MSDNLQATGPARAVADAFLANYCRLLDDVRLEEWVALFGESSSYRILSRENVAQGLPGAILLLETRAAMADRVAALRQTAVYNIHHARRFYSGVLARELDGGRLAFSANVGVYQSDAEGHSSLFCVGQYDGILAPGGPEPLVELTVTLDTFAIPTLLAIPV